MPPKPDPTNLPETAASAAPLSDAPTRLGQNQDSDPTELEQRRMPRSGNDDPAGSSAMGSRYALKEEVGKGGMGVVHMADDLALERPVALKLALRTDDEHRRIFRRERRVAGRLEHPSIIPLYDAGIDEDGRAYLAMRYVQGETLKALIERLRQGDPETHALWRFAARCRLVLQLLNALELAHTRSLLHRDIKPDNVMLGPFGEVFLVDWGLACSPEESDHEDHRYSGTPRYMSPEQARGERLDARSDLYAIALLLYELLTLTPALKSVPPRNEDLAHAISTQLPPAAEHVRHPAQPAIPRALSLVVMQALQQDPAQRFATAADMRRALERFLAGEAPIVCITTACTRGLVMANRALDAQPRTFFYSLLALASFAAVGVAFCAHTLLALWA